MCVKELIDNIIEMESLSSSKVDPKILKKILMTCPINFELPHIDEDS